MTDLRIQALGPWALIHYDRPAQEITAAGLIVCRTEGGADEMVEGTGVVVSVGSGQVRNLPTAIRQFHAPVQVGDRVLFKAYLKGAHSLSRIVQDGEEYFFIHKLDIIGTIPAGMTIGVVSIATGANK